MKTLQIEPAKAKSLYPTASQEFKSMLEDTFGKNFFIQKITDKIKTYEDAREVLGINPMSVSNSYNDTEAFPSDLKSLYAYEQLIIICRALNEGWQPNWNDTNERKWYPYFDMSGFGFSNTDYGVWYSYTDVGSRLCFKSSELAEYAAKQFKSIYKDFLTI